MQPEYTHFSELSKSGQYFTIAFYGELLGCDKLVIENFFTQNIEDPSQIKLMKKFMFYAVDIFTLKRMCIYVINLDRAKI